MTRIGFLSWAVALVTAGLVALAIAYAHVIAQVSTDQQANTQALCTFRADLVHRVNASEAFLLTHPHGISGISASEIRTSVSAEQRTVRALHALICPA